MLDWIVVVVVDVWQYAQVVPCAVVVVDIVLGEYKCWARAALIASWYVVNCPRYV